MMDSAFSVHGLRGLAFLALLLLIVWSAREFHGRLQARTLVRDLLSPNTAYGDIAAAVDALSPYRRWAHPRLIATADQARDADARLRSNLALLSVDASRVDYLCEQMLRGPEEAFVAIRGMLADCGAAAGLIPKLRKVTANRQVSEAERLRAACALASYAPGDPNWGQLASQVADQLVLSRLFPETWIKALEPMHGALAGPLADLMADERRSEVERATATSLFAICATRRPELLSELETRLSGQPPDQGHDEPLAAAHRQANLAVSLLLLGRFPAARSVLRHSADPTARTALVHRLSKAAIPADTVISGLRRETDDSIRHAALLALGEYGTNLLSLQQRAVFLPELRDVYLQDTDPGVRQAARWLLGRWGYHDIVRAADRPNADQLANPGRRWWLNSIGQVMVAIPAGQEFGWRDKENGTSSPVRIPYPFAVSATEVTVENFSLFLARNRHIPSRHRSVFGPSEDCPVNSVSWYDAAAFCNWLSHQEGIREDQLCYLPNEAGQYGAGMRTADDWRSRSGYRLPTSEEWECVALAGASTDFFFGQDISMIPYYCCCADSQTQPVHLLKPNDLGLFGTSGNIWEWCHSHAADEGGLTVTDGLPRLIAGGTFGDPRESLRSPQRVSHAAAMISEYIGFRVFRTLAD
jgi:formylglycine-generating enzyme required for sulfatase activity